MSSLTRLTPNPLAQREHQRRATRPGLVVHSTFSPARAWRPTVGAPLARTLGVMIRVLFDTNIYDRIASDPATRELVSALVAQGEVKVFVTRTIAEELRQSPFEGVPAFFPFEYVGNTVGRAGIMCAGDSIGSGSIYYEHLGESLKNNDAFIVDAASWYADWLVSEDERLLKRASGIVMQAKPMKYQEFIDNARNLSNKNI